MDGRLLLAELLLLVSMVGGQVYEGFAPHYSPKLMAKVAHRRDIVAEGCMISSARHPIRTKLYVYGVRTGELLTCIVVDVSHPRDKARHIRTGREIEVSWEDALRICGSRRERPTDCPVIVVQIGGSE